MKYVDANKIKTEIDTIINGLKKSCNPDPMGTTMECITAAEIETLELVKDIVDKLADRKSLKVFDGSGDNR